MSILNELKYEEQTLDNGLKVLTVSSPHLGLFSAELVVKKGLRDELYNQTQWTHLLEHIMATNSARFPDQITQDEYLSNNGIYSNAYTTAEFTAVWGMSAPEQASVVLDYIFDAIKKPIINQENIDREVAVINQEHKQKFINHDNVVYELAFRSIINGTSLTHNLGLDHYWLKTPTVDELKVFHHDFVNSENMVLITSGPLDADLIASLIEKTASEIKGRRMEVRLLETPTPKLLPIPLSTNESKIVALKWLGLKMTDPLIPALQLYNEYLTGNLSAPLNKKLRLENQLTYGVGSGFSGFSDLGTFSISFKSSYPQQALDLVREVINSAKDDLNKIEIQEMLKKRIILDRRRSILASPNDLVGAIGEYYLKTGRLKKISDFENEIENVTTAQLEAVVDLLAMDKALVVSDDPTLK